MTLGNGIFQKDNAPIHKAFRKRQFLWETSINLLDCPTFNPDMNYRECTGLNWTEVAMGIWRLEEQWWTSFDYKKIESIDWESWLSQISFYSMVNRVGALLASEGGFTKGSTIQFLHVLYYSDTHNTIAIFEWIRFFIGYNIFYVLQVRYFIW